MSHKLYSKICNHCGKHYKGIISRRFCSGSCALKARVRIIKPIEGRFWSKVDIKGEDECWEWKVCKNGWGYGNFDVNGKKQLAHRVAWELTYGPIPEGLLCLHTCDNPACNNPKHLWLGTNQDNVADMVAKGRQSHKLKGIPKKEESKVYMKGSKNGRSRLTEQDVICIRVLYQAGVQQAKIARMYKISPSQINLIIKRKAWTHI